MKRRIEKFIPKALEAIEKIDIRQQSKKNKEVYVIAKQFNGYISSFGASMRQAGLYPTVLFYNDNKNAEEDRSKIVKAVEYIIGEKLTSEMSKKREVKLEVVDATTALKLAIRTYEQSEES